MRSPSRGLSQERKMQRQRGAMLHYGLAFPTAKLPAKAEALASRWTGHGVAWPAECRGANAVGWVMG